MLISMLSRIRARAVSEIHSARQAAVEARLLPGHDSYTRFIVVTNIRSGSTLLTRYLSSHPSVRMFFELFHLHIENTPFNAPGYARRSRSGAVAAHRIADPVGFMTDHVFTRMPLQVRAVGFKLLHTQARKEKMWWDGAEFADWWTHLNPADCTRWRSARSDLWAHLAKDRAVKVILLARENHLEALISAELAKTTGRWGKGVTGGIADGRERSVQIKLDTKKLRRDFEAAQRQSAEAAALFAGHDHLATTYEELTRNPHVVLAQIQDLIGVPRIALSTDSVKQRTGPISKIVSNWDEVRRELAGTPWQGLAAWDE